MALKPPITIGDDNKTPTTAVQQADTLWAQLTASGDGYHETIGAKVDTAATTDTGTFSLIALFKRLLQKLTAGLSVTVTGRTATGYEQLTVSNVVKQLTPAEYAGATHAVIAVEDAELRYTLDGTDPTTTLGTLLYVSDTLKLDTAADIAALKMIRTGSTDAEVNVAYEA